MDFLSTLGVNATYLPVAWFETHDEILPNCTAPLKLIASAKAATVIIPVVLGTVAQLVAIAFIVALGLLLITLRERRRVQQPRVAAANGANRSSSASMVARGDRPLLDRAAE